MGTDKNSAGNCKNLAVEQHGRVSFQVHEEVGPLAFCESLDFLVDGERGGAFLAPLSAGNSSCCVRSPREKAACHRLAD
eukprot:2899673-Pyramimonas_sp.AAC.1